METNKLVAKLKNAFGNIELPLAFWFSDYPGVPVKDSKGCYIKALKTAREGISVSFDKQTIKCGGGRVYAGFMKMPEGLPNFVSVKEKYKASPEQVRAFISDINIDNMEDQYLNFARIDTIESLDNAEGVIFFATPDILSGLITFAIPKTRLSDMYHTLEASCLSGTHAWWKVKERINQVNN